MARPQSNKKYNKALAALYRTREGGYLSMEIDTRSYDAFKEAAQALEVGGKIIVKVLAEDSRAKFKNPETAPHAFLELISKDNVASYKAKRHKATTESDDVL